HRHVQPLRPKPRLACPSLAPSGQIGAYAAGAGFLAADLYVVPVTGGQPRRLTSDGRLLQGLTWTGDSKEIVFSSNRGGLSRLWRIPVSGGTPAPLSGVGEDVGQPAISGRGRRLAYVDSRSHSTTRRRAGPGWQLSRR